MNMPNRGSLVVLLAAVAAAACSGESGEPQDDQRDLTLAPAESVTTINDAPESEPETPPPPPAAQPQPRPQPQPQPRPQPRPEPPPPPEPAADPVPDLDVGTELALYAADTLTSRHSKTGEPVTAMLADPVYNASGQVVIPAGAVVRGTISDLAPAESPGGEGRMVLTFTHVEFDGQSYAVQARTDSIGSRMKGRGVTAGDAAKVGAGAVVGAIAGRIIGGNKTGTAVGAAAGAAAGVGIAAATRDIDIILDAGAPIRLILTAPFYLEPMRTS